MTFRTLIIATSVAAITAGGFAYAQSTTPLLTLSDPAMEQPLDSEIIPAAEDETREGKKRGKHGDKDCDREDDGAAYEDEEDDDNEEEDA